jgi:hypothetical protein
VHPGLEHPPDAVSPEDPDEPRDVILVGMGQHDNVDPPVPGRHLLVESDEEPVRIRPAVDEHPCATAAFDQDRVALAHIKHHEACRSPRDIGHRQRGQRDGNRDHAERQPTSARGGDRPATLVGRPPGARRWHRSSVSSARPSAQPSAPPGARCPEPPDHAGRRKDQHDRGESRSRHRLRRDGDGRKRYAGSQPHEGDDDVQQ